MADATKVMADVIDRELKAMEREVASKVAAGTHDELGQPLMFRDGNDPRAAEFVALAQAGYFSPEEVHEAFSSYDEDHAALVGYLLSAVRRKDWHAVSDAANDLRVLEASRR